MNPATSVFAVDRLVMCSFSGRKDLRGEILGLSVLTSFPGREGRPGAATGVELTGAEGVAGVAGAAGAEGVTGAPPAGNAIPGVLAMAVPPIIALATPPVQSHNCRFDAVLVVLEGFELPPLCLGIYVVQTLGPTNAF